MKLTADDVAYLQQAAARDHYNPNDALKVFSYESSGRPDVWGGKGNKYFGIFQAGPSERQQFGIDTTNPSAKNQIDAFGKFLSARGYKPGMGLLDMYSTVNAGSPGHYSASDGNGTVASHVAKMMGTPAISVGGSPSSLPGGLLAYAPTEDAPDTGKRDVIGELIAQADQQKQEEDKPLPVNTAGLLGEQQPQFDMLSPAPMVQHMQFGGHIPRANTFTKRQQIGLLGR